MKLGQSTGIGPVVVIWRRDSFPAISYFFACISDVLEFRGKRSRRPLGRSTEHVYCQAQCGISRAKGLKLSGAICVDQSGDDLGPLDPRLGGRFPFGEKKDCASNQVVSVHDGLAQNEVYVHADFGRPLVEYSLVADELFRPKLCHTNLVVCALKGVHGFNRAVAVPPKPDGRISPQFSLLKSISRVGKMLEIAEVIVQKVNQSFTRAVVLRHDRIFREPRIPDDPFASRRGHTKIFGDLVRRHLRICSVTVFLIGDAHG